MGNCLPTKITNKYIPCLMSPYGFERFPLVENSDTIMHLIETNGEAIKNLNDRITEIENTNTINLKAISDDIDYINTIVQGRNAPNRGYIQSVEFSHQSSSRYGGNSSESIHAEDDGPSLISSEISEYSSALR